MTEPMTRAQVKALLAEVDALRMAEKWQDARDLSVANYDTVCTALLATMTELEQVKGERDVAKATIEQLHGPLSVAALVARAEAAETALAAMTEREGALRRACAPFKDMAGEMFARNWNRDQVAIALDNPADLHRLTFGDFLDLHAALTTRLDAPHPAPPRAEITLAAVTAREERLREALADAAGALDSAGAELSDFANILSRDPWQANHAYESALQARAALQHKDATNG